MKPIQQEDFFTTDEFGHTLTRGGCLLACIASIMELPYKAIPKFNKYYEDHTWRVRANAWLMHFDLHLTKLESEPPTTSEKYYIVTGESPRFAGRNHCCVWYKGQIIHDPHPDNRGLNNLKRWQELLFIETP